MWHGWTKVGGLALAAWLLAACSDDPDRTPGEGSSSDPFAASREPCVDRINDFRASVQLPPLERWTSAERCSDSEAESDADANDPHGAFGQCGENAQNECPGWPSINDCIQGCLQMMWDEGPGGGHYDNMTSTSSTRVACGFHVMDNGSVWSVQNFSR